MGGDGQEEDHCKPSKSTRKIRNGIYNENMAASYAFNILLMGHLQSCVHHVTSLERALKDPTPFTGYSHFMVVIEKFKNDLDSKTISADCFDDYISYVRRSFEEIWMNKLQSIDSIQTIGLLLLCCLLQPDDESTRHKLSMLKEKYELCPDHIIGKLHEQFS